MHTKPLLKVRRIIINGTGRLSVSSELVGLRMGTECWAFCVQSVLFTCVCGVCFVEAAGLVIAVMQARRDERRKIVFSS